MEPSALAAKAAEALEPLCQQSRSGPVSLNVRVEDRQVRLNVPAEAVRLLREVLGELGKGHAVTIVPTDRELTTQQAADVLNVSRPYLIELLEAGRIPFRKVGTRRKVRLVDVSLYKDRDDAQRRHIADELALQAADSGMEY